MKTKRVKMPINIFPTKWQSVLFRNYGLIPMENIARVLSCSEEIVRAETLRLGLSRIVYNPKWTEKGYITIIRNNWFLLPCEQICALLGISQKRLDFILQNDDFLWVKLGEYKPECERVTYTPLTQEQIIKTERLGEKIKGYIRPHSVEPFDFFADKAEKAGDGRYTKGKRIVHGYLSPCGDAFMEDGKEYMPDALLEKYAGLGINGVWLHGVLSTLSPYPFDETLSTHYQTRRKNMKELIARCQRYGIKVYLYFNEPRALPEKKFGKYSHLIGRREKGLAALCFEQKETQEYLYNAVKDLLCDVSGLGGIITITMSENLTHCNYRPRTNCPVCKNVPPEQSAASVNNIIQKAIADSGAKTELIANLWGWSPFMEWTQEQTLRGVELLDENIAVMCVSEYDLEIEKGGVKSKIIDYSIANPGPSDITKITLKKGAETGHKLYAKIQTNNSWECSAVPYLPVFDLYYAHLQNLSKIGVCDYMLTWTLGGYPSPMLSMAAAYAQDAQNFNLDEWYKAEYGQQSETVRKAVGYFCKGFQEYPFSIDSLYFSPKTLGCANLWDLEGEGKQSTMVCFAFDDYQNWTKPYPVEIYLSQYEKLLTAWGQGLALLEGNKDKKVELLQIFAKTAYSHFQSDYLQTKFSYLKENVASNKQELKTIVEQEKENAQALLALIYANACVGFEASNHYYYTDRNIIEKILLLFHLEQKL